jgi:hypothetical protein
MRFLPSGFLPSGIPAGRTITSPGLFAKWRIGPGKVQEHAT